MRNDIDEGSDEKMHWLNVLFDVAVSYFLVLFQKRIIALCVATDLQPELLLRNYFMLRIGYI